MGATRSANGTDEPPRDLGQLSGLLGELGLSPNEAQAYVLLLHQALAEAEVAEHLDLPKSKASDALMALERRGMIKRIHGRPVRFTTIAPKRTLPLFVRNQERKIQEASLAIQELSERFDFAGAGDESERYVEVVTGREGVRAQCNALEDAVSEEIVGLMKPPLLISPADVGNAEEAQALARGIRTRWVYDSEILEYPGALNVLRRFADLGEECRVLQGLPGKMMIVDQRVALVHVTERIRGELQPVGLVIRHPELVSLLSDTFAMLWNAATPLFSQSRQTRPGLIGDDEVVQLLLAGMKDQTIARQLGLSKRTLARRISELMHMTHAQTRFQAGYRLGLDSATGSVSPDPADN